MRREHDKQVKERWQRKGGQLQEKAISWKRVEKERQHGEMRESEQESEDRE